jgi:hypothetical protein
MPAAEGRTQSNMGGKTKKNPKKKTKNTKTEKYPPSQPHSLRMKERVRRNKRRGSRVIRDSR